MKRIVEITVDNYKAYIQSRVLSMPKGENILLYGENGSGKSSLYKAIRYFFSSSVELGTFETNKYSGRTDGKVELVFQDVDPITKELTSLRQSFIVCTDESETNNIQPFIKLGYRVSGFLDYTQLLRAYYSGGRRPDLFNLVLDLIGDHIPIKQGLKVPIKTEKDAFLREMRSAYHRFDWAYRKGRTRFDNWNAVFPVLMKDLDNELSKFMSTYFPDLNLQIKLNVPPVVLRDDGKIADIWMDGHIFIDVLHYGQMMNDYNETLNEARLSAIAICLYLASLKLKAEQVESKVLYLDDVFLGLDLGNRKPVLNIILNEFQDYQVFISTYDRSWYFQAKEFLEDRGGWLFYELYEGTTKTTTNQIVANPIVVKDSSFFDRACDFLNDNEHPDYPAAANYLRKAFEELLQKHFFKPAVREEQFEFIPAFKLTQLVNACRDFVRQIPNYCYSQTILEGLLTELIGTLHPLLHPLSHYAPDVPVYKAEVISAVRLYQQIESKIEKSDYDKHCRVFQERGCKFQLILKGTSGWKYVYTLKLIQNLYLFDNATGGRSLSNSECRVIAIEESAPGMSTKIHTIGEKDYLSNVMRYKSFEECWTQLRSFLSSKEYKTDIITSDIYDSISFPDENNNQRTLNNLVSSYCWV